MQDWVKRLRRQRRGYEHYVVVMQAHDVLDVQRTLSKLGIALDGTTLRVHAYEDDVLYDVTPNDIKRAVEVLDVALRESWLGWSEDVHDGA